VVSASALLHAGNRIVVGRRWQIATLVAVGTLVSVMLALQDVVTNLDNAAAPAENVDYGFPYCQCKRMGNMISEVGGIPSSCSDYATSRGSGQKIVTYSYYGDSQDAVVNQKYFSQIRFRAQEVGDKYPGWTMRVYFDSGEDDFEAVREMCAIWCETDHVDFCDVNNLPRPFGNLKSLMPVGEHEHGYMHNIYTFSCRSRVLASARFQFYISFNMQGRKVVDG
jgi:hypothetical protein